MWHMCCNRLAVVLLMVFAIGYSSIAIASAQSMHLTITSSSMSTHNSVSSPCSDMQAHAVEPMQNMMPHEHQQHKQLSAYFDHTTDCKSNLHEDDCIDCQLNLCQSNFNWLQNISPQLASHLSFATTTSFALPYQAQYLTGYWQVLLRPPQQ